MGINNRPLACTDSTQPADTPPCSPVPAADVHDWARADSAQSDTLEPSSAAPGNKSISQTAPQPSARRPHLRLLTDAQTQRPQTYASLDAVAHNVDTRAQNAGEPTKANCSQAPLPKRPSQRPRVNFEALRKGWKTVASPVGITGIAVETAWHAAHAAMYPFGLVDDSSSAADNYSTDRLQPKQRAMVVANVEATETPIILLHGMIDNRSIFTRLRKHLQRQGFSRVSTVNYSPFTTDVRNAAQVLAEHIAKVVEETGCEHVHVVGHSLGGLIARYYVQKMGGDRHVDTLVTLGTPHQGTLAANIWFGSLVKQLRPGSDLLAELETPCSDAHRCRTKFICYWSDLDHLVLPSRHGRMTQPELTVKNILVRGVGHMTLPIQPRLIHDICHTLGKLQQPGASLQDESSVDTMCVPDSKQTTTAADEHVA